MQGQLLFEYAVIRIVPKVEREEFLNVGIILYCSGARFLQAIYVLDEERLSLLRDDLDIEKIKEYLNSMERICEGGEAAGPIGLLPVAERFRWLTATRSTVVQTSKVHPGFCTDPSEMLMSLFKQLVL